LTTRVSPFGHFSFEFFSDFEFRISDFPLDRRRQIEDLFTTYAKGVGAFLLARVADPELAEAITSRVFLIVVRNVEQCTGSPVAWLWSIVRSELARHFRDRKRHAPLDDSLPAATADEPLEQAARREMHQRTRRALERLPDDTQQLVYMKFFQGMPNKDIAVATGLTPTNVGVQIHRALKQLRTYLEPAHTGAAAEVTR
jgi:RNA polymerase sigma-70 factor (ECF subfamily)